MDTRTTLLGLLVLAGLFAFVWFDDGGRDQEDETPRVPVFGELEADGIQRISLPTTGGEEATLERQSDGWMLSAPLRFRADAASADAIAGALADLASDTVFDDIEPLASYGLDGEPRLRFRADGAEYALHVGDTAPVGAGLYVTDGEGTRVWLVDAWRTSAFEKSLHQLRDGRLVDFDAEQLRAIEVRWPGARVRLVRGTGSEEWRLEAPLVSEARAQTVTDLLSDLRFLRAAAFVDEPTPDQLASFDPPLLHIALASPVDGEDSGAADEAATTESSGSASEERIALFEVGGPGSEGRRLVRGRDGVIAEIAEADWQEFPGNVTAFRRRELARFLPVDAKRFRLAFAGGSDRLEVSATRSASGDWGFDGDALAAGRASRLLSVLSRLEAIDIAAETMGRAERAGLGLEPPRARLTVWGEAEEPPLADVTIGRPRSDGVLPAQRSGGAIVYWLDADVAEDLPVSADAFREAFRAEPEASPESGAAADDAPPPTS